VKKPRGAIRLSLAFLLQVALLIAIGHLGLSRMHQIDANLQDILVTRGDKVRLARNALDLSNGNSRLTMEIFLLDDPKQVQEALANRAANSASISALVETIAAHCESQEETDLLAAVNRTRSPYVESYKRALHLLVEEGNRKAATAVMVRETLPAIHTYHDAWNQFVQFQASAMDVATEQGQARYASTRRFTAGLIVFAVIVAGGIALVATRDITREMNRRMAAQREVATVNDELEQRVLRRTEELARAEMAAQRSLAELRAYTHDVEAASAMVESLQSCLNLEEAHEQVARSLSALYPAGALLMVNPSGKLLDVVASWGSTPIKPGPFPVESCWALRRGRFHLAGADHLGQLCGHVDQAAVSPYICVPMIARGESLGVLCLQDSNLSGLALAANTLQHRQGFALTLAEQISLALANLRLRETLKYQSVRDPLTNLFNRRHMEATLEREIHRARRNRKQVPLLMMDLDHFKQFNDSFGHEGGDILLREFGSLITSQIRASDVACRYGGEEFVVILVDAALEGACRRADVLRQQVQHLKIQQRGQTLRQVTVSIGVAAFPDHGNSGVEILHAADLALYAAKAHGRNRIVVAEASTDAKLQPSKVV